MQVRPINESTWYVFTDPKFAHKVKACTQDSIPTIKCDCATYTKVNSCKHTEHVMAYLDSIGNPFHIRAPKKKDLKSNEYIGGDYTQFLTDFLSKVSY